MSKGYFQYQEKDHKRSHTNGFWLTLKSYLWPKCTLSTAFLSLSYFDGQVGEKWRTGSRGSCIVLAERKKEGCWLKVCCYNKKETGNCVDGTGGGWWPVSLTLTCFSCSIIATPGWASQHWGDGTDDELFREIWEGRRRHSREEATSLKENPPRNSFYSPSLLYFVWTECKNSGRRKN